MRPDPLVSITAGRTAAPNPAASSIAARVLPLLVRATQRLGPARLTRPPGPSRSRVAAARRGRGPMVSPILAIGLALTAALATTTSAQEPVRVSAIGPVGFTVTDVEKSVAFFTEVLDFRRVSDIELAGTDVEHLTGLFPVRMHITTLALGSERIELTQFLTPWGRPVPADMRSNDLGFQHIAIVVRDMGAAYRRLREHGVRHVSPEPQRLPDWNPNAGGIEAFYFTDPDGHVLEVIHFPAGKGDPRWQQPDARLFLGIDHTAIVVKSTDASLRFYRDALGLRVAGQSENHGIEQERLNATFGAHLRITGLRADHGPGIEFLEYLTPGDGRPLPADERASDIFHWQTTLRVAAPETMGARLRDAGVIAFETSAPGFAQAFRVRDPDGHVMQIVDGPAPTGSNTGINR